jgi:putative transposase
MDKNTTMDSAPLFSGEAWFDPIEAELRERIRGFLEEMVEQEATAALGRGRYQRGASAGYRNGTRSRRLLGSFGPVEIAVPRARLFAPNGTSREWQSAVLPRYARMTRQVEALIASGYLAGTNTRRVKRALGALFKGAIGKDVVSRVWRKVKTDWEAWTRRDLAEEDIVRLVPRVRPKAGPRAGSRRQRGARAARPQGHQHLAPGRPRHPSRRAEGSAHSAQHGRRERSRLAGRAR